MTDREAMERALAALELVTDLTNHDDEVYAAIDALRERLADSLVNDSLTTGSCIACGNRMTGSPEHFVVATAEGVTAPEGYSPQQVGALHPHKVGDKTSPPLVNRIADILVEDHITLMTENKQLRDRLAQPEQKPRAKVELMTTGGNAGLATRIVEIEDHLRERLRPGQMLYTAPLQRKPLTNDEIRDGARKTDPAGEDLCAWSFECGARFAEAEHGIKEKHKCCTSTNTQMGS